MQNRKSLVRPFSRFPVSWPVRYGNETFLAEGTVLDLTTRGWRRGGVDAGRSRYAVDRAGVHSRTIRHCFVFNRRPYCG